MKITNNHGMPEEMRRAAYARLYDKGGADVSITELLSPDRITLLKAKYGDQIEEDVRDLSYSLIGSAFHHIMQESASYELGVIAEQRIHSEITGLKVSGQIDRQFIRNGVIEIVDYKVTSVAALSAKLAAIKQASRKPLSAQIDWIQQTNLYAYLASKSHGLPVSKITVYAYLRDWMKPRAMKDSAYPQSPVVKIDIKVYTHAAQYKFLLALVARYKKARADFEVGGILPECTTEEMWATPDEWVILSGPDSPRALVKYNSLQDAEKAWKANHNNRGSTAVIQRRPGDRKRCEMYCPVVKVCDQYRDWKYNIEEDNKALKIMADVERRRG